MSQPPPRTFRPSQGSIEGRHDPRVGVDLPVDIYSGSFAGPLPGRTRDVGLGGICAATGALIAAKSIQRIVLKLPDGPLEMEAEGVWQRDSGEDSAVLTGIAFVRPDDAARDRLWELVVNRAKDVARFLHARSDLATLGIEEAMGVSQVSRQRMVAAGKSLYRQDSHEAGQDSIYLITAGRISLQVRVRDARETTLDSLGPGRLFGGLPLITGEPHAESAVADRDSELIEIDRSSWRYLTTAKPWLAQRLAEAVVRSYARRIREVLVRWRDQL